MNSGEFVVGAERNERYFDHRHGCWVWSEPLTQYCNIWQPVRIEFLLDQYRKFSFTGALMGERQQFDRYLACTLVTHFLMQYLEGSRIGRPRKQLIAVDQVEECHRLLAQRMDHVPIIDDMAALGVRHRPSTLECQYRCRTEEALHPIIVETHTQIMADEPRWCRVEDALQIEAAARCNSDDLFL